MPRSILMMALLALAACRGGDAPAGTTPGEAQALNDAAAALDANSVGTNAAEPVLDNAADGEEQPQ